MITLDGKYLDYFKTDPALNSTYWMFGQDYDIIDWVAGRAIEVGPVTVTAMPPGDDYGLDIGPVTIMATPPADDPCYLVWLWSSTPRIHQVGQVSGTHFTLETAAVDSPSDVDISVLEVNRVIYAMLRYWSWKSTGSFTRCQVGTSSRTPIEPSECLL